jgi:type II secretory pathway pseudopilin PulG
MRGGQWGLLLLLAASLGLAWWMWRDRAALEEQAVQYERAARRVQDQTRRLMTDARLADPDVSDDRLASLRRQASLADRFLDRRSFSWTRFLSDLESAVPQRISVGSVGLNFKDAVMAVSGSALTMEDLTAFINAVESHASFRNVVLAQHRIRDGAGGSSVEFTLTVTYRPPFR